MAMILEMIIGHDFLKHDTNMSEMGSSIGTWYLMLVCAVELGYDKVHRVHVGVLRKIGHVKK